MVRLTDRPDVTLETMSLREMGPQFKIAHCSYVPSVGGKGSDIISNITLDVYRGRKTSNQQQHLRKLPPF